MGTYEVFLRKEGRDSFQHAGALDAHDDELALLYCRETYVRRGEGVEAWVVRREHIGLVDATDLAVTARRQHAINDGSVVAARRKSTRVTRQSEPADSSNHE